MYLDTTVQVPQTKGKIIFKKKGASRYVLFETERVYDPKRQFNIPKRVVIGKLVSADNESRMVPNENFLKHFPDVRLTPVTNASRRSNTISVGTYIAFSRIVDEYGLDTLLQDSFGDKAQLITDLASYLIVNEDNAGQYYPDYARRHALFTKDMSIVSDSTVSRLFSSVTSDQITSFLDAWNRKRDHRQRIYLSYDSINKNSQAGDLDMVEFGHPKDDQGLAIFNVALTFDNTNRVPLFYEQYPGSVNDVSQLSYLIDKIHAYGYRSIGIILDRGYFSRQNIEYIDEKGFRFLMMVKSCKSLVSSMIRDNRGTFETVRSNHIAEGNLYGMTIKQPLYKGDQKQRYFHLFFNPMRMALEREELERKVEQMALELKKLEGAEDCKIGEPFSKYFTLHYQELRNGKKRFLFAEEKADAIAEQLRLCGYFCLISSEKMTAADAYRLYRGRDISEKLFRADKSFLGSKSLRVCSNESVSTKIFIEFVALIVRNRFYNLLKDEMLRLKVRRNWMTVPAAIRELEKIEMTRRNGTRYLMDYALTRNQKLILQCFGLSPEDVAERTQEISKTLANVEEQLSGQPEEDENAETQEYGND
jgi:transposase